MKKLLQKNLDMETLMVTAFFLFFVFGSGFILYSEKRHSSSNAQQDWWIAYFENPKSDSLNFVIENNGNNENFHWEVYLEKNRVHENDTNIPKGEKRSFQVSSEDVFDKKISIRIVHGSEAREIYKIIEKNR